MSSSAYSLLSVVWIQVRNSSFKNKQTNNNQLFLGWYHFTSFEVVFGFEYFIPVPCTWIEHHEVYQNFMRKCFVYILMPQFDDRYENYPEIFINKYGTEQRNSCSLLLALSSPIGKCSSGLPLLKIWALFKYPFGQSRILGRTESHVWATNIFFVICCIMQFIKAHWWHTHLVQIGNVLLCSALRC